jgi:hypothetical protein
MKSRILVFVGTLLCCATWCVAQNTSPDTNQPNPQGQTAGAPNTSASTQGSTSAMTVEGCLSGSGGNYTLKGQSGTDYNLTGATSQLSAHVGHEVQVTGSLASTKETGATSGPNNAPTSATAGSTPVTLNVISVKHVATSCTSNK